MYYVTAWLLIGLFSYLLATYIQWAKGRDITLSSLLMVLPTTLLGLVALYILVEDNDFVIFKGKDDN